MQPFTRPASSGPRADHPQFPSAIYISSFYPHILCDVISSYKFSKKSKSKLALHSLSHIQNRISFFFVLNTENNLVFKVSLFDYHSDLNHKGCIVRDERRDEIDKKDIQRETKLMKKNIKINISFPQKELRTAVSKSFYTLNKQ